MARPRKITSDSHVVVEGPILAPFTPDDWLDFETSIGVELGPDERAEIQEAAKNFILERLYDASAAERGKLLGRGRHEQSALTKLENAMHNAVAAWREAEQDEVARLALAEISGKLASEINVDDLQMNLELVCLQLKQHQHDLRKGLRTENKGGAFRRLVRGLAQAVTAAGADATARVTYKTDLGKKPASAFQTFVRRLHDRLPDGARISSKGEAFDSTVAKALYE